MFMLSRILIVGVSPRAYPVDDCNATISGQPRGPVPTSALTFNIWFVGATGWSPV